MSAVTPLYASATQSNLLHNVHARQEKIEQLIQHRLQTLRTGSALSQAFASAIIGPAKRFRALLVLASGEAVQADSQRLYDAAVAIEMVHAHTLVLDDLPCMDDEKIRRGRPALHRQFGEATALLAASTLLTEAFAMLSRANDMWVGRRCQVLAEACGLQGIAQGQWDDLNSIASDQQAKTAPLIAAALKLGALCTDSPKPFVIQRFENFGLLLGRAFQYRDDAMDNPEQALHLQLRAEKLADQALLTLSHAGLDTPLLRKLVELAIQRRT